MGVDEAGADFLCVLEVSGDNKLRNNELRTFFFLKQWSSLEPDVFPETLLFTPPLHLTVRMTQGRQVFQLFCSSLVPAPGLPSCPQSRAVSVLLSHVPVFLFTKGRGQTPP